MKKNKKISPEKKELLFWKSSFNINSLEEIPAEVNHVDLRESEITDEEMGYICQRIKRIGMLDLHYTTVSNEGIGHLLQLEWVKELRLKGNAVIDNGCMPYITKLTALEFLHLRYTAVNVAGLLYLSGLPKLTTVLLSTGEDEAFVTERMKEITTAFPDCTFQVNEKSWFPLQPWERLMKEWNGE